MDLASAVTGVLEFRRSGGGGLFFNHEGNGFLRDQIRFFCNAVIGVEGFADGDTSFVSVVDPRRNVHSHIFCPVEPSHRGTLRRSFCRSFIAAGIAIEVPDDMRTIPFALVERTPLFQIADGTPGRDTRPDLRMTPRHEQCHVSAT